MPGVTGGRVEEGPSLSTLTGSPASAASITNGSSSNRFASIALIAIGMLAFPSYGPTCLMYRATWAIRRPAQVSVITARHLSRSRQSKSAAARNRASPGSPKALDGRGNFFRPLYPRGSGRYDPRRSCIWSVRNLQEYNVRQVLGAYST